ncbi:polyprenyl synthetase family protein [Streptomyces sp. SID3343]|uniref:polyprenyl synthetase family protein n=1 Tax=Streptomyces sp. SID3343 TaxID=2690260 RepID=UPI0013685175|nr:polyprenyl synthetase family protein [Streptomyces sp. SID3343]MYV98774.1 polyprenyl synthetase family protein [Streptomyces sp. SID3343]
MSLSGSVDPDGDTVHAVEEVLGRYLRQRLDEAATLGEVFAAELAADVVSFAMTGGKRLRACLTWWAWRTAGGRSDDPRSAAVLRIAAAWELLQVCALVHDDIMDDAPVRRGRSAVHVGHAERHRRERRAGDADGHGRSMAILAGDLALVWADDLFAESRLGEPDRSRAAQVWRAVRTEMVAGQHLDLYAQAAGDHSPATALRVAHGKSALYSVDRPMQLGAVVATADTRRIETLRAVGRQAGVAFQLHDDLLDAFGDPEHTGKPGGNDLRAGKSTYLLGVALERADRRGDGAASRLLRESLGVTLSPRRFRQVREVLVDLGARAAVEQRIDELVGSAFERLADADVDADAADRLRSLLRRAAGREPYDDPDLVCPGSGAAR